VLPDDAAASLADAPRPLTLTLSPRSARGEGICCGMSQNRFAHHVECLIHFRIPEPQDLVAGAAQEGVAASVVGQFIVAGMSRAVDLHDEPLLAAGEIGDIWPDRHLPHELEPAELAVANDPPQPLLGRGQVPAKFPAQIGATAASTTPDWEHNQLLDAPQAVLSPDRALGPRDVVANADGVDPHTRHKAGFYVEQIANALAPTNFALTNPQVMRHASPRAAKTSPMA
jgi:hypothetical protein